MHISVYPNDIQVMVKVYEKPKDGAVSQNRQICKWISNKNRVVTYPPPGFSRN